jgi:hypothetical protein
MGLAGPAGQHDRDRFAALSEPVDYQTGVEGTRARSGS